VRPAGVVFDVRAHTLPQFNSNPPAVFAQLLQVVSQTAQAWTQFGAPTPLTVTVPNFFDTVNYVYTSNGRQASYLQWVR